MPVTQQRDLDLVSSLLLHDDRQDVRRANYGVFQRWYAALARREFEPANILFHGDSVVHGAYATAVGKRFVDVFADSIQRMYRVGGSGFEMATQILAGGPTPWTLVGGTSEAGGIGGARYSMAGTTQTAERTFTGDRIWLFFSAVASLGNAEIVIDGGTPITVSTVATPPNIIKWDSGTLAPTISGTHTVLVRGATGHTVKLNGVHVFNTDYSKGVQIWKAGLNGGKASDFTNPSLEHWYAMKADMVNPHLVFIEFGLNEEADGVTEATYKANIATVIDNYRAATGTWGLPPPSICLLAVWARADQGRTNAQWLPYRRAMRQLAIEKSVAFFDLYDLAGWLGQTATVAYDDVAITSGSAVITSQKAFFRSVDVGKAISVGFWDSGIPGGTTIASVQSATQATMSANATATKTTVGIITSRADPNLLTTDLLHPGDRGSQWIADELTRLVAGMPRQANIPQGTADAKGDLIVADAVDSFRRLAVGTEGQALHAAAGAPNGVQWADPGMMGRIIQVLANPGAATFTNVGLAAAPTVTDPGTGTPGTADQADGPFVRISTAATIGSEASVATPFNICRSAWVPEFTAAIRTYADVTNIRLWAGLFSATPGQAADPGSLHGVGFRYDAVVDTTAFWRCYSKDGTTAHVTVTTVAVAIHTKYRLRIESFGVVGTNATEWRFYINDVLVGVHTANLPGGAANNLGMYAGVTTLLTGARDLLISRMALSYV